MIILPLLHFFCLLMYALMAGYVFYKDPKSLLNKLGAALIASFSVWSFIDIFPPNDIITKNAAVLFQNISSVGWIGFASFLLGFSLAFSNKEKLLRNRWFLAFIIIVPIGFIYKQWTNDLTIHPVQESFGWTFSWKDTIWSYLYFAYYISFTLISVCIIYLHGIRTKTKVEKNQSRIIIIAVIISLTGGTITDVIFPILNIHGFPQIGDVFLLVFAVGIIYAVIKYNFLTVTSPVAAEYIISAMEELLIHTDNGGNIIYVNKAVSDTLKYEQKELTGAPVEILFSGSDFKNTLLVEISRGAKINNCNGVFLTKEAKEIPVIFSCSSLKEKGNEIKGLVFIARDITGHIKDEEELRESALKFKNLVETLNDWVWEIDSKGIYIYASPKVKDILGYDPEEVITKTPFDLMPKDEAEKTGKFFEEIAKKKEPFSTLENWNIHKNGRKVLLETSGVPVLDKEGNLLGYRGIDRDITERRKATDALIESERYRLLLENTDIGFVVIDGSGKVLLANEPYNRIAGVEEGNSAVGRSVIEWTAPEEVENNLKDIALCIKNGFTKDFETTYLRADGSRVNVQINANLQETPEGKKQIVSFCRDITDRRKTEEVIYKHLEEQLLLSDVAGKIAALDNLDEIYNYIGNTIYKLLPDSYVFLTTFIPERKSVKIILTIGFNKFLNSIQNILGFDPFGFEVAISEIPRKDLIYYKSRILIEIPDGLYTLSSGKVGKSVCNSIEKILGVKRISFMGFAWNDKLYGGVSILQKDNVPINNKELIEVIINQAAVAIQRKHAEDKLTQSEERYRSLVETSPNGIVMSDLSGRIITANKKTLELFGYPDDTDVNMTSKTIIEHIAPRDRKRAAENMAKRIKGDILLNREYMAINSNGTEFPVEINSSVILDVNNKPYALMYVVRDISERVKANEEIKAMALMLDTSPNLVIVHDLLGNILYANQSSYTSHGYTREEFLSLNLKKITIPETTKLVDFRLNEIFEKGSACFEVGHFRKDGSIIPLEVNALNTEWKGKNAILSVLIDISEHRKMLSLISDVKQEWEDTFDTIPDLITIHDKDHNIIRANKAAQKILNLTDTNIYKDKCFAYYHGTGSPPEYCQSCNCLKTGVPANYQIYEPYLKMHIEVRSIPRFNDNNEVIGSVHIVHDITEQKRAENAMFESEARYRNLFESMPVGLYIVTPEGKIKNANKTLVAMLGYKDLNAMQDINLSNIYLNSDGHLKWLEQIKERDILNNYISQWKTAFGEAIWIQESSRAVSAPDGNIIQYEGAVLDISEKKKTEDKLAIYQQELENLVAQRTDEIHHTLSLLNATIESSDDAIVVVDQSRKISTCNKRFIELWEISAYLLEEGEWDSVRLHILSKLNNSEVFSELYDFLINSSGQEPKPVIEHIDGRIFEISTFPQILNNNIIGRIWNFSDITDRINNENNLKRAKETAEQATRAKSIFLANMSHEIRTPMNAVIGFSDMLINKLNDPVLKELAVSVKSSGNSLLDLINNILDLSKIEAGKMEIKKSVVNIRDLLNKIKQVFIINIQEKNLNFIVSVEENFPDGFEFDEIRLRQIITNLVGNAVKFTDKGYVRVSVWHTPSGNEKADITITVEDSGIGIIPEYQSLIFDTFVQQEHQDAWRYGGTGLGLSITKTLVSQMKGEIILESTSEKGSKFKVLFYNVNISTRTEITKQEDISGFQKIEFLKAKILIIDNDQLTLDIINNIFENSRVRIITAKNGSEGINLARKKKPDVILLDLVMPEMDGLTVLEHIRKDPVLNALPVISVSSVSGYKLFSNDERLHRFDGKLQKPITLNEINRVLSGYLPHKVIEIPSEVAQAPFHFINKNKMPLLPGAILFLKKEARPVWQKLISKSSMTAASELSEILICAGKKYKIDYITEYGNELALHINTFDIEKMKECISRYPAFIKQLEKCK